LVDDDDDDGAALALVVAAAVVVVAAFLAPDCSVEDDVATVVEVVAGTADDDEDDGAATGASKCSLYFNRKSLLKKVWLSTLVTGLYSGSSKKVTLNTPAPSRKYAASVRNVRGVSRDKESNAKMEDNRAEIISGFSDEREVRMLVTTPLTFLNAEPLLRVERPTAGRDHQVNRRHQVKSNVGVNMETRPQAVLNYPESS